MSGNKQTLNTYNAFHQILKEYFRHFHRHSNDTTPTHYATYSTYYTWEITTSSFDVSMNDLSKNLTAVSACFSVLYPTKANRRNSPPGVFTIRMSVISPCAENISRNLSSLIFFGRFFTITRDIVPLKYPDAANL